MKLFCFFVLFILLCFPHLILASAAALPVDRAVDSTFHIVLDPGHGGGDLGATRDTFIEAQIVLQIATRVKQQLDLQPGFKTTLTRAINTGLSLKNRVALANDLKADLFVSLHANTSNSEYVNGMEFYFNSPNSRLSETRMPGDDRGPTLTNSDVIAKIKSDFQFYEKTEKSFMLTRAFREKSAETEQKSIIRRAPFYVIDHTSMPSILIELGFISNRREAKKLTSQTYQDELARLLTAAILKYKEKSDKLSVL